MKYLIPKQSKTLHGTFSPPKQSRNILCLMKYHDFLSLLRKKNETFLVSCLSLKSADILAAPDILSSVPYKLI